MLRMRSVAAWTTGPLCAANVNAPAQAGEKIGRQTPLRVPAHLANRGKAIVERQAALRLRPAPPTQPERERLTMISLMPLCALRRLRPVPARSLSRRAPTAAAGHRGPPRVREGPATRSASPARDAGQR
jgi:hypothetical protein